MQVEDTLKSFSQGTLEHYFYPHDRRCARGAFEIRHGKKSENADI
jgi:hypothetical protein